MTNLNKIFIATFFLLAIVYISVWVRLGTINAKTILDYDPWWFYRYAKMILENDFKKPEWDYLSFSQPGRPVTNLLGWPYTIALISKVGNLDLMYAAKISPLIMVALAAITSFLTIYYLTKNLIAALFSSFFLVLAPSFLPVSVAGYNDTDAPIVFYAFLSFLATILAIQKRKIIFYAMAIFTNLLFIFNWGGGWLNLIIFFISIPFFVAVKFLEALIEKKNFAKAFSYLVEIGEKELKPIILPFFIIFTLTNLIGYLLNFGNMFTSFFGGLAFTALSGILIIFIIAFVTGLVAFLSFYFTRFKKFSFFAGGASFILIVLMFYILNIPLEPLIVNISVAELQLVNPFSFAGFLEIAGRTGILPTILTFFVLPVIALYKLITKKKIDYLEVLIFLYAIFMFFLISRGVRFSLQFLISAIISFGYSSSFIFSRFGKRKFLFSIILSIFIYFSFITLDNSIRFRFASSGMEISNNWYEMLDWLKNNADKDAMVATWWDPGHIIAGYTGLKVHADGAHCGECYPYNHNFRIQDMGKIFHLSEENESLNIIKKYVKLNEEQCEEAKRRFKEMPKDACKPISEVYLIASNDLIGKYFWMSCFATFDWKIWNESLGKTWKCDGRQYFILPLTAVKDFSGKEYGGIVQIGKQDNNFFAIVNDENRLSAIVVNEIIYGNIVSLTIKDNKTIVILPLQDRTTGRVERRIVEEVVYFENGIEKIERYSNNIISYMAFVDPSYSNIILMDEKVKNSMFTKLFFFDGKGLNNFKLVLKNPEIRLYKVLI